MLHHLSLSNCDVPDQALKNMEVSKEGTHTRMPQSQPLQFAPEMLSSLWQTFTSQFAPSSTGPAGRAGRGSAAEGEGGRGGQAGRPAGQEREGDPEEGHQEGEAETQDYLQGSFSLKHSDFDWRESQSFS